MRAAENAVHHTQAHCGRGCWLVLGLQVTVDVPWSPYDIDGRSFDWKGLAAAADLLFIMLYDTQSQVWPKEAAVLSAMAGTAHPGFCQGCCPTLSYHSRPTHPCTANALASASGGLGWAVG